MKFFRQRNRFFAGHADRLCFDPSICDLIVGHRFYETPCIILRNLLVSTRAIIKVKGHEYWWLAGSYDLEIRHF